MEAYSKEAQVSATAIGNLVSTTDMSDYAAPECG